MGEYFNDIISDDRTLRTILKNSLTNMMKGKEITEKTGYNLLKLAEVIEDTFLPEVVACRKEFLEKAKQEFARYMKDTESLRREVSWLRIEKSDLSSTVQKLQSEEADLERKITEKCNEMKYEEIDPVLAGAMKAFDWIMKNTGDKSAASKAFNSYLLGGRFNDGETYTESVMDADEVIAKVTGKTKHRRMVNK